MKLFMLLLLMISSNLFSQTIDGINSGLDTSARANKIKSKVEFFTHIKSSGKVDTMNTKKYYYSPNGYITKFEKFEGNSLDSSLFSSKYYCITFEYNDKGYLINHLAKGGGPLFGAAPLDSSIITTTKFYKGENLKKEILHQTSWYESETWTNTTEISYDDYGKIIEQFSPPNSKVRYYYLENGLLFKIEHSYDTRINYCTEIQYQFYE